jgi:hypothetical protein
MYSFNLSQKSSDENAAKKGINIAKTKKIKPIKVDKEQNSDEYVFLYGVIKTKGIFLVYNFIFLNFFKYILKI